MARTVLFLGFMKRLKTQKLSIDTTTIRVLTHDDARLAAGGKTNTDTIGTTYSGPCTKAPPPTTSLILCGMGGE